MVFIRRLFLVSRLFQVHPRYVPRNKLVYVRSGMPKCTVEGCVAIILHSNLNKYICVSINYAIYS